MGFIAAMLLPFAVCVLLAGITAGLWWSTLNSPWLYVSLSLLTLLGLHRVIQVLVEFAKLFPITGGYFLEARRDPARFAELVEESLTVEAFIVSGLVVVAGLPVLMALRSTLGKA